MDEYALDVDATCKDLSGENDFLAELEYCNFVGVTETTGRVFAVGVILCCLDVGNFAFSGGR